MYLTMYVEIDYQPSYDQELRLEEAILSILNIEDGDAEVEFEYNE